MSARTPRETLRRGNNVCLIAAFLVLIWLPIADTFLHLDHAVAPDENRAPARFPAFQPGLAGARQFFAGLESYYGDHFGFRRQLVSWEQHWKWQLFRDSKPANAIIGKEGWLFYTGRLTLDDIMGNRPFSDAELRDWREFLRARRDWLAARGIRYLFVIPPDKHTIYPENLPQWLAASARPPQRLEQFVQYMRANSDLPILDLRGALLAEKKNATVYLQTDSHWNERGAFVAYRRIAESLSSPEAPIAPLDLSDFQIETVDQPAGDIGKMFAMDAIRNEKSAPIFNPRPHLPAVESKRVSLADVRWNPGTEPIVTENAAKTGRVLVFRDSFAISLTKFLGHNFNRVVYLWRQNWDKRFIEREKPQIVIDEMVERFLIVRSPSDLRALDEQPDIVAMSER